MAFEHKGTPIAFNEKTGEFFATINGVNVRKPSLDAMRKVIDESKKVKFDPFKALTFNNTSIEVVKVVGVDKARRSDWRAGSHVFIIKVGKNGLTRRPEVTPDTAPARVAIRKYQQAHKKETDERKRLDDNTRNALSAIPAIRPDEFTTKK